MLSEHKLAVLRGSGGGRVTCSGGAGSTRDPPARPTIGGDRTFEEGSWWDSGTAPRDRPPGSRRIWNQILPKERDRILETALLFPEWSPRQVSCQVTDTCGFTVSESSVYRILKAEG